MGLLMAAATSASAEKQSTHLRYSGELSGACATQVTVGAYLEPAILGAPVVFTLNGAESCSGTVDGNGIVSCQITLLQPAGTYHLTATYAGNTQFEPAADMVDFTVTKHTSSLVYTGVTTSPYSGSATVAARLSPAVAGATLVFKLGNTETCSAATNAAGIASCSITPGEAAGTYPLTVSYAGGDCHKSASLSVPFTVTKLPTAVTYTGATSSDEGQTVTASATLSPAVAGATLVFVLATGETCSAVIDTAGAASCPITPQTPGVHAMTVSYAGNDRHLPSSATVPFTVIACPVQVSLEYTGDLYVANAEPVQLSGVLRNSGAPIAGRTVSFVLGAGATAQGCSGVTDASGKASCTVAAAAQPLNATATLPVTAAFAGDGTYLPASDADTALLQYMTGAGYALRGSLSLLLTGTIHLPGLAITGNVRTADASNTNLPCILNLNVGANGLEVIKTQDICANVVTTVAPGSSTTTATIAKANINLLGLLSAIEITGLQASSHSTCSGASGSGTVVGIKVGGVSLQIPSGANAVIPLGVGKIILNEQIATPGVDHGRTVTAVRIVVPPLLGLAGVDIALGTATSGIDNCRPHHDYLIGDTAEIDLADGEPADGAAVDGGGCTSSRPGGALGLVAFVTVTFLVRRRRRARIAA
jgi:hypothetical protein